MFAGRVVYAGCQFGVLFLLAQLDDAQVVGMWGLALAVTAPVFTFLQFHLRSVVATDANDKYRIADYIGLSCVSLLSGVTFVLGVVLAIGYSADAAAIILVVALAKGVECVSEVFLGVMQRFERLDVGAKSFAVKGAGTVAVVALLLLTTESLLTALVGMLAVWTAVLLLWDIPQAMRLFPERRDVRPRFSRSVLRRLMAGSLPLGLSALAVSLNLNIPRYLVEGFHGRELLGYMTALTYMTVVGDFIVNAVARSGISRLGLTFQSDRIAFRRLFAKLLTIAGGIGVCGVLFSLVLGRPFLALAFGADYAVHATAFVWFMAAAVGGYANHIVIASMVSMRMYKAWAGVTICGAALCLVSGTLLVPRYGLTGAAWAFGIASWLDFALGLAARSWGLRTIAEPMAVGGSIREMRAAVEPTARAVKQESQDIGRSEPNVRRSA